MTNREIAKELLSVLKEKMWYREGLPSDGWAVEKIIDALVAAQQSESRAEGVLKFVPWHCYECGGEEYAEEQYEESIEKERKP